jgi:hypothetical protein
MTTLAGKLAHDVDRFPLIVFVHVPKTAGTTVNQVLWLCSERGLKHYGEAVPNPELLDVGRCNDWLSAHIPRELFATSLIWLDRPIEYFSAVREPISQLLSSLNWQFEIHNRGPNFLHEYPPSRLEISEDVRATDFSKTASIIALLLRHAEFFLDCQARYIVGCEYNTISYGELARRVASFSYIATEQDLPALYQAFGFAILPGHVNDLRENASQKYHFDTTLFQSQEILDFLAQHHCHDFGLYDCVHRTSWSAEGRRPFRPAFPIVTPHNYEEKAYLDFNPDVVKALKCHPTWRSGHDHFVECGHAEQRRQVILPNGGGERRQQALEIATAWPIAKFSQTLDVAKEENAALDEARVTRA